MLGAHPGASAHLLYNAVGGAQGARGAPAFFEHAEPEEDEPEEAAAATAEPLGALAADFEHAEPEEDEPEAAAAATVKPLGALAADHEAEGADSRRFFVGFAKAFSASALWAATQRSICSASQGHDLISQG